jgi:hypothetical protein
MSKTLDFTCPKCGFIIKAPYAEQVAVEHMKTHFNDKIARVKISKTQLMNLQKQRNIALKQHLLFFLF